MQEIARRFFLAHRTFGPILEQSMEEADVSPTEPMTASPMRGLFILCVAYFLAVATFVFGGLSLFQATFVGGEFAFAALAVLLFSRGILDLFIGIDREITFFIVLRNISDPLIALVAPITPSFLLPFAVSLYAAFLFYFFKVFLFGDMLIGAPPLFFYLVLGYLYLSG